MLSHIKGRDPMAVLATTPRRIATAIEGHVTSRLRQRPGPGRWSVAEIIVHLADAELVAGFRFRMMLAQSGTRLQTFDQNKWAAIRDRARIDPRLALEDYRVLRANTLRLLRGQPRRAWSRYGMHPERGKESVSHYAAMMAGHDLNHLAQIRRLLR
jgi:hypothetical protein